MPATACRVWRERGGAACLGRTRGVRWRFTEADARIKLRTLYPRVKE
jgi:hypothetical protein